jgi:hypothetical protein
LEAGEIEGLTARVLLYPSYVRGCCDPVSTNEPSEMPFPKVIEKLEINKTAIRRRATVFIEHLSLQYSVIRDIYQLCNWTLF